MNPLFSRTALLALVLCCAAGAVHGTDSAQAPPPTFTSFWDFAARAWSAVTAVWQEAGSSLDPFGNPSPSNSDAGSHLDPFGEPATSNLDEGSSLDPFGGIGGTSQAEAGSDLDPFGRPTGG